MAYSENFMIECDEDEAERTRSLRREAQRKRRDAQDLEHRDAARRKNTAAQYNARHQAESQRRTEKWWDVVAELNKSVVKVPLRLKWNRNCKYCGIKVLYSSCKLGKIS
ncbi:hypothetical protein R3P38DRAFT_2806542 [Favolaschia claudopus]|uniref:Recombination activating protein 1 n=1 Tax=Favolaschia claudopus TaxID=2862362 RepID=A0AAV9ZK10_9AGAR